MFKSVFLTLMASCACYQRPSVPVPEAVAKLEVTLVHDDGSVDHGSCTAWKAPGQPHRILSAGHCAPTEPGTLVTWRIGDQPLELVAVDHDLDLSLFSGDLVGPELSLASREPAAGDLVSMRGWPGGVPVIVQGVWGYETDYYGRTFYTAGMAIGAGFSGSAVQDAEGQVVGMLVAGDRRFDFISLIVPVESIRDFLASHQVT